MNLFRQIFLSTTLLYTSIVHADLIPNPNKVTVKPLIIATKSFSPPFVMRAGGEIYGFDIDMINALCKIIGRTCQFKILKFDQIIDAVASNEVDAAVSSITITQERSKLVAFTLPYSLSYSQFLTNATNKQAFSLLALKGMRIGVESGSIFTDQIQKLGIINPKVVTFDSTDVMLDGLRANKVDYLLVDSATAVYWAANSAGAFRTAGESYDYGFGFGIAVNPREKDLLENFNAALLQYQNSPAYKQNYNTYLKQF